MNYDHQPIIPDPVLPLVPTVPGTDADAADYAAMCADVDSALESAWWRVIEWDRAQDPHGWWHDRSDWIALHNEVLRLRAELADMTRQRDDYRSSFEASDKDNDKWRAEAKRLQADLPAWLREQITTRQTEIETAINLNHQMGHYSGTRTAIDIYRQVLAMLETNR